MSQKTIKSKLIKILFYFTCSNSDVLCIAYKGFHNVLSMLDVTNLIVFYHADAGRETSLE